MIQEGIYFDVEEVKRTKEQIDKEIFIPVDMEDNGDKISFHTFSFVPKFRPYWKKNPKDYDECFGRAVATAIDILREIIRDKVAEVDTKKELQNRIRSAEDGMMLLSDQEMPWKEGVCSYNREHNNEIKFVIFPYPAGGFAAQCVPPSMEKEFDQLVPFPEAWAGGNEETLPEISGIPDAIFCHNKRFFARAKSKESVIRMCEIAMGIQ